MTKIKNDDPLALKIGLTAVWAALMFLMIYFGFFAESACRTWGEDPGGSGYPVWEYSNALYCAMHPLNAWAWIGFVLVCSSITLITGVWSYVFGLLFLDKGEYNGYWGYALGSALLGLIFIYAL